MHQQSGFSSQAVSMNSLYNTTFNIPIDVSKIIVDKCLSLYVSEKGTISLFSTSHRDIGAHPVKSGHIPKRGTYGHPTA